MPSKKKIFDYWNGKISIEENKCFKCKKNRSLQRAHILAVSSGGSDDCDNIHLLCSNCHKHSEILDGEAYWMWLNYPIADSEFSEIMIVTAFALGGIEKLSDDSYTIESQMEFRKEMKQIYDKFLTTITA